MSIRREARGRPATLIARVATACTAVAAVLAVTAPSASAFVPCPTHDIPAIPTFWRFETVWPTGGDDPRGVTLCKIRGSFEDQGFLQIADLRDGAAVRLVSETDGEGGSTQADTRFHKRTAEGWYSYIRTAEDEWGPIVHTPEPSLLFSTTNASFFKNGVNGTSTTLPFPQWSNYPNTWGVAMTERDASGNYGPDYYAPKKQLTIAPPNDLYPSVPQRVDIDTFWTQYDWYRAYQWLAWEDPMTGPDTWDATVSFAPTYAVGGTGDKNRRNYVGTFNNKVYILTSTAAYTSSQANDIMTQIQPGMEVIQLDGGGSAQMHSDYASLESNVPFPKREVPDVLAIYRSTY